MYKIIGADGKEYGPITAEQLRQWITEGRANLQTQVLPEGATEWKMVSQLPEFAAAAPHLGAPQPAFGMPPSSSGGLDAVNGPAIGLICVGLLGIFAQVASLVWTFAFRAARHAAQFPGPLAALNSPAIAIASAVIGES